MPTDSLYYEAAKIVSSVSASKGTIRSLCFGSGYSNKKALFALVSGTCRNLRHLEYVVDGSGLLRVEKKISSRWLACVLLQDFLFKKALGCQDQMKDCVLRHKSRIASEFVKAKIKLGEPEAAPEPKTKKYVRINALKGAAEHVIAKLEASGFKRVADEALITPDAGKVFAVDSHIDGLLVLPSRIDLSKNPLYLNGSLIIQDKASCMPAFLLNPPAGSTVVDSCSAPGNKTSHLAAIIGTAGTVLAFERDPKRFQTLTQMLDRAACSNVTPLCADFLTLNPLDPKYRAVEYCLVDPSCSGSGIIKDHENIAPARPTAERLQSLSNFQKMIVRHALKFPNLRRLVYSTCSVHEEENEGVVAEILQAVPEFGLVENPLPTWTRRGMDTYPFGEHLIRADPVQDGMHGFFVALFERKAPVHDAA